MTKKYFYFIKALPLEEIYQQTLTFWQENKGSVVEESLSLDNLVKTLKIHREMTLTSNGEDYMIEFSYNHRDSKTYIRIEVSLVQGYGIQWLTPKKLINKWVSELKITPTYLVGRKNEEFFDFDKIPGARPRQVEVVKPKIFLTTDSNLLTSPQPQTSISTPISVPTQSTYQTPRPTQLSNNDKPQLRFCTFCGAARKNSARFCVKCGKKFE